MSEAFGKDWQTKIKLDPIPVGAGSVAQVFRGMVRRNDKDVDVAVKLIHPHVERLIKVDMDLLSSAANFIDRFPDLGEMEATVAELSLSDTCIHKHTYTDVFTRLQKYTAVEYTVTYTYISCIT